MLRRVLLAAGLVVGLLTLTAQTAFAWDLVADKDGYGRTTLRTWTRGYGQVAFVADHAGTRIAVAVTVDCANGDHYDNTWNDGGQRFRVIVRNLPQRGRCEQTFRVTPRSNIPQLHLSVLARG